MPSTSQRLSCLLVLLLPLAACAGTEPAGPSGEGPAEGRHLEAPRFIGTVTDVVADTPAEGATTGVWIRTDGKDVGLVVWPMTTIADESGAPVEPSRLRPGVRVRVWVGDSEYLSIPPQYDALRIELN